MKNNMEILKKWVEKIPDKTEREKKFRICALSVDQDIVKLKQHIVEKGYN